jgi:hypothetical protein
MPDEPVHFPPEHPIETAFGAHLRIRYLLHQIEQRHGIETARKLFREAMPSPRQEQLWRGYKILARLDRMPEPGPWKLAGDLIAEAGQDRYGPDGEDRQDTQYRYIHRLMQKRDKAMKAGKWRRADHWRRYDHHHALTGHFKFDSSGCACIAVGACSGA